MKKNSVKSLKKSKKNKMSWVNKKLFKPQQKTKKKIWLTKIEKQIVLIKILKVIEEKLP